MGLSGGLSSNGGTPAGSGGAPSGAAGGKLSGTYPNPGLNAASTDLTDTALLARLASPALSGTPTVPTAAPATNSTQAASTAYADAAVAASGGGPPSGAAGGKLSGTYPNPGLNAASTDLTDTALLARLASPALSGTPTAPTQTAGDNSTKLATTAYIDAARQLAVLSSDLTAINTQTVLQNVTGLGLTIGASASEMWLVKYWLLVSSANATMDLKLGFTVPTSCTMKGGPPQGGSAGTGGWSAPVVATAPAAVQTQATTVSIGTGAAATNGVSLVYIVFGGGTGGTVQVQYAQNTSDAGNLQVLKGSVMEATRLAV